MNFTQLLFQHIHFAPPEMQAKFNIGISRWIVLRPDQVHTDGTVKKNSKGKILTKEVKIENPAYWNNNADECLFNGLWIKGSRVYVINVFTFNPKRDYEGTYLDVTSIFKELLKEYNIYHACLILQLALKNYYKDSTLTENLIPIIKYDRPFRLPKFRYQITRHHNRHKKFIDSGKRGENLRVWNQIILRAISKIEICSSSRRHGGERPSLFTDYRQVPRINTLSNKVKSPSSLPNKKERVPRRRFGAFNPQKGR